MQERWGSRILIKRVICITKWSGTARASTFVSRKVEALFVYLGEKG
jgi:hypothetical protein